jgi:hypothetical protein
MCIGEEHKLLLLLLLLLLPRAVSLRAATLCSSRWVYVLLLHTVCHFRTTADQQNNHFPSAVPFLQFHRGLQLCAAAAGCAQRLGAVQGYEQPLH